MVVIVIGIQIVRNAIAVGIIVHRVAVLRIVVWQCNVFVDGINTVAVVVHIQIIGYAVGIGILGIVGISVAAGVGIFVDCEYMITVVVVIQKIEMRVGICIPNGIVYCSTVR